jgi:hypothetical protein
MTYAYTDEASVEIQATTQELFDYLDDQSRLGAHMEKRSMMMMGGRMTYAFDAAKGRAVGSVIRMGGSFLGLTLDVEEIVTERAPPTDKAWETRGRPRMIVIESYRMGFKIAPLAVDRSRLRVFIAYNRPKSLAGTILAPLFAPIYAHWCVKRMADDAAAHFGRVKTSVGG